jgi:hypothetical protein
MRQVPLSYPEQNSRTHKHPKPKAQKYSAIRQVTNDCAGEAEEKYSDYYGSNHPQPPLKRAALPPGTDRFGWS